MDAHIPKSGRKKARKKKLWMTRAAVRQQRKKYHAWKRFRETNMYADQVRAKCESKKLEKLCKKLKRSFEKDISMNAQKNPKAFWRYCRSQMKTRATVGNLRRPDGKLTRTNKEKVDTLNEFFSSVFTQENLNDIPSLEHRDYEAPLSTIRITEEDVLKKLRKLKKNKSDGPDGFHPRVLSECASCLCKPLTIIFNKSLEEGKLPLSWKEGHVSPVYKNKGSRVDPGNYRPISLTSVIGKIMESLIRDAIVAHMMKNDLFCDEQHGFVPRRSCMTQPLLCIEEWTSILDERNGMLDIIYLDFKKAFDSVPHQRLTEKLRAYGVAGEILAWLIDFLTGRKQRVVIGNEKSNWAPVTSGIPQGSVLGPILFVIYINDLPDAIDNIVQIFADDTKIYSRIRALRDNIILQNDLDKVREWSRRWQ